MFILNIFLRKRYPDVPYSTAGFSFGSGIALRLGCETPGTQRAIAVGLPTRNNDFEYLKRCGVRKVFVQSTHDEHGPREELEHLYDGFAEPKQILWIEARDHFFAGAVDALEDAIFRLTV